MSDLLPKPVPKPETTASATTPAPSLFDTLIDYPSPFPIKVMGQNVDGFVAAMTDVARQFDPEFDATTIELRHSSSAKYLGLTLTITATSRVQLDALYTALSGHPLVKVVL